MLYRLAMVRTNNQADAEEVVQDTFLRFMYQIKNPYSLKKEKNMKLSQLTCLDFIVTE